MATTTVSDAVVVPQAMGTGLGSEDDNVDAGSAALLAEYIGGEYVGAGMGFQNHDGANDTVDVGPGYCFVTDDSGSTGGSRGSGGNAQIQSTSSTGYDTEIPNDQVYLVIVPTAVTVSCSDATLNQIWVNVTDVTSNNAVEVRSGGGGGTTTVPGDTYLKLGEANPDDATADTRANDNPSLTLDELTTDELNNADIANAADGEVPTSDGAGNLAMEAGGSGLWTEDGNSPVNVDGQSTINYTFADTYDVYLIDLPLFADDGSRSSLEIQLYQSDGSKYTSSDYYTRFQDGSSAGSATEGQLSDGTLSGGTYGGAVLVYRTANSGGALIRNMGFMAHFGANYFLDAGINEPGGSFSHPVSGFDLIANGTIKEVTSNSSTFSFSVRGRDL